MFWLKMGLLTFFLFILISSINFFLKKVFKIKKEKKSPFSYNHINDLHKKVDWTIRIGSMIVSLAVIYLVIFKEFPVTLYLVLLVLLIAADYLVRATFEWKYSSNPKQAILTLNEMSLIILALILVFQLDFFNIFAN